jgi:hypothetical protein
MALGGASLWMVRRDVAALAARIILERQGMGPVVLHVTGLDLSGAQVQNIRLYGGAIEAAELNLAYHASRLAAGVVDRVVIDGLRAKLDATSGAITIGDARLPFAASSSGGSIPWRVDALRLNDAHLSIATPGGSFEAGFSTDLAIGGNKIQNTGLVLDLAMAPLGGLHIRAPELALTTQADGGIVLDFGKLDIQSNILLWGITDMTGAVTWSGGRLAARLDSGLLASTQAPPVIVPLVIAATASSVGPQVAYSLHATDGQKIIDFTVAGQHDRVSGAGKATVASHPIVFRTGGLQPKTLFPAAGQAAPKMAGTISVSGAVAWRNATLFPALVLHLSDVAVAAQGANFSKVNANVTITGLSPLITAAGQVIHAVITSAGLPPVDAELTFQLLPTAVLHVQGLDLAVAGGRLSTSAFNLDSRAPDFETLVSVRQVDLAEIFKLIGVDGLDGTGRLDGSVELSNAHGKVTIRTGHLAATGPGRLRIAANALPKEITQAGERMALVLQALADFHYDALAIDIVTATSGAAGASEVALVLKGQNPAVLEGRAFNLNIKLAANLDRLIGIALRSIAAAEALLRQAAGSIQK